MTSRRHFLKQSVLTGSAGTIGTGTLLAACSDPLQQEITQTAETEIDNKLAAAYNRPVLKQELFPDRVEIESMELLLISGEYVVRVRSTNGAEGSAISNWGMNNFYPIFLKHVAPFFTGKDARKLDQLITDCFLGGSHYKMQSMAIWTPVAAAEMAVLDLLGQVIQQPLHSYLGDLLRPEVAIYWANNYRGESAEESVRQIAELYEKENPPAVKAKIAGRMGAPEEPTGRTERMIPLLRKRLGDKVTIYADANGGYNATEAIRIGHILEDNQIAFFEEPCPFYDLWATQQVAEALKIPVAAGEQESSARRFQWMLGHGGVGVAQPDLFYYGGIIRSIRVARMAEAMGKPCTPHVSGGGINMLYIAHFAAITPNAGEHQEYKSPSDKIPFELIGGHIKAKNGLLKVPNGPGMGFRLDPDWVKGGKVITRDMLLL